MSEGKFTVTANEDVGERRVIVSMDQELIENILIGRAIDVLQFPKDENTKTHVWFERLGAGGQVTLSAQIRLVNTKPAVDPEAQ